MVDLSRLRLDAAYIQANVMYSYAISAIGYKNIDLFLLFYMNFPFQMNATDQSN